MDFGMIEKIIQVNENLFLRKLEPSDGMVLTNGETYNGDGIYLGKFDKPENWHEIHESEVPTDNVEE